MIKTKVFVVARIEGWQNSLAERIATTLGLPPGSVQVKLRRGTIEARVEARAMKPESKFATEAVKLILFLTENHWPSRCPPEVILRGPWQTSLCSLHSWQETRARERASFVERNYNPDKIRKIVRDKSSPIRSKLASAAKHLSDAELQDVFREALEKSKVTANNHS
jgi:hypothetical protein